MVVDGRIVVEIKSTEILHASAHRQLLSYLRSTNLEVGLLLHFGPEARFYRAVTTRAVPSTDRSADPPDPIQ
jgi:GxxExxY protein